MTLPVTPTLYKNLKLWDGVADALSEEDSIAVQDGRILGVSPSAENTTHGDTTGFKVRDMGGLYAIPGLIDAHIHLSLDPEVSDPMAQPSCRNNTSTGSGRDAASDAVILEQMRVRAGAMVKAGITTARDLGGGAWLELRVRDEINAGRLSGPRLLCAGQPVTSVHGHCHFWGGEAADTDEALSVLERQHDQGVDLIKVMATGGNLTPGSLPANTQFADDTLNAIVARAAHHGYHVAAHCHGTGGIRQAVNAGVTTIEHCSWVGKEGWGKAFDPDVVAALAASPIWVSPTISANWQRFVGKGKYATRLQRNFSVMKAAGVKLIASTDAGIPNVYHHHLPQSLPVFAHFAGLSIPEVLRAATSDCAAAIGLGRVTGQIQPGYMADIAFYEGNPLQDLTTLTRPVQVLCSGRRTMPAGA